MSDYRARFRSVPASKIIQIGSEDTHAALEGALAKLSDAELSELDEELHFFGVTGLVGLAMSRLLVEMEPDLVAEAA